MTTPAPHRPEPRHPLLRAFWEGATRPSRYALLTIFTLNLAFALAVLIGITSSGMAGTLPSYLANAGSFDEFATGAALRLALEDPDQLLVVVLGASATREALHADDLDTAVEERLQRPVSVYNLATGQQSLYDSIALAERIPSGARCVVIIGIGPTRLTRPPSDLEDAVQAPRLGFRSEVVEDLARAEGIEVPGRTGIYAIDNIRFLAPRLKTLGLRLITQWPHVPVKHLYQKRRPLEGKAWVKSSKRIAERLPDYAAHAAHNLALFDRLVRLVRDRTRARIVAVEHPLNPRFVEEFMEPGFLAEYRRRVAGAAAQLDVPYLVLNDLAVLGSSDFYDWCHLRDREAIRRCSTVVADAIAPLLSAMTETEQPR